MQIDHKIPRQCPGRAFACFSPGPRAVDYEDVDRWAVDHERS